MPIKSFPLSSIPYLADVIIYPGKQKSSNKRCLAWSVTIILGIISLGSVQLISWAILKVTKGSVNHGQSARTNQVSKSFFCASQGEKVQSSSPNVEQSQKAFAIKEIYAIHKQLIEGVQSGGWLAEHINSWKLNSEYTWSKDYLIHTKDYLSQLLLLKDKSDEELEALFDRGLRASQQLLDTRQLKTIVKGRVWFNDGIIGENLLIKACFIDSTRKAIPILLKAGVDPNQRDRYGNTPLHWSVANASVKCAFNLIRYASLYKIDFDLQDWKFSAMTPLQLAICKGRRNADWDKLVYSLIAHTKHLNKQDKDGNTALHLACVRRDLPYIKALRKAGASFEIRNNEGKTPKDLWAVSSDEAWKILKGDKGTTTFDRKERERLGSKFPQRFD
ncbi:hypothetical protein PHSC3_001073 [Chlamydiales bacterium STE3]|nr:hypothetical protein PHSC3_001073 [Chlamydiales bacterium STE3]